MTAPLWRETLWCGLIPVDLFLRPVTSDTVNFGRGQKALGVSKHEDQRGTSYTVVQCAWLRKGVTLPEPGSQQFEVTGMRWPTFSRAFARRRLPATSPTWRLANPVTVARTLPLESEFDARRLIGYLTLIKGRKYLLFKNVCCISEKQIRMRSTVPCERFNKPTIDKGYDLVLTRNKLTNSFAVSLLGLFLKTAKIEAIRLTLTLPSA